MAGISHQKKGIKRFTSLVITTTILVNLIQAPAHAFIMNDESWTQLMIRYSFDFSGSNDAKRIAFEFAYAPAKKNFLLGGTIESGFSDGRECLFGATFNTGYLFDPHLGDHIAIPAYLRMGMVDTSLGVVLAVGFQTLFAGTNIDALATWRAIRDHTGICGCGGISPEYTFGMDIGLGLAIPDP